MRTGENTGPDGQRGGSHHLASVPNHDLGRGAPEVDHQPFAATRVVRGHSLEAQLRLAVGADDAQRRADGAARVASESLSVGGRLVLLRALARAIAGVRNGEGNPYYTDGEIDGECTP